MKKTLTAIAAIGCIVMASAAAHASDGTITFTGELTAATCTANVNNSGPDGAVTLPSTSVNVLDTAGKKAGATSFGIALSGCSGSGGARTFFETGSTVNDATGRLMNTITSSLGGATNVELELLDDAGGSIFVGGDTQYSAPYASIVNGSANLTYAVRYYATGTTTPGTVASMVAYTMDYQ